MHSLLRNEEKTIEKNSRYQTDLKKFVEIITTSDENVLLMLGKFLLECYQKRRASQSMWLV